MAQVGGARPSAERAAELAALELERPVVRARGAAPAQSLEERARAAVQGSAAGRPPSRRGGRRRRSRRRRRPPGRADAAPPAPAPSSPPSDSVPRAPFIPPRIQRPPRDRPRGPKPVFSSSAPAAPVRPGAPSRPGQWRLRRRRATFGPDAEKGGGRKKGKKGKRSTVDQDAVQANILQHPAGHEGRRRPEGPPRPTSRRYRDVAGRPDGRGAGAARRPGSGSTSSSRSPSSPAP